MLVTSKEASKMYCPQAFASQESAVCAGLACMAWRFTDQHTYTISTDDNGKKTRRRVYKGYCGLAGRP